MLKAKSYMTLLRDFAKNKNKSSDYGPPDLEYLLKSHTELRATICLASGLYGCSLPAMVLALMSCSP